VDDEHTEIRYEYGAAAGGRVASVGSRLLNGATRIVMNRFFEALAREAETDSRAPDSPENSGGGSISRTLGRLFGRSDK